VCVCLCDTAECQSEKECRAGKDCHTLVQNGTPREVQRCCCNEILFQISTVVFNIFQVPDDTVEQAEEEQIKETEQDLKPAEIKV